MGWPPLTGPQLGAAGGTHRIGEPQRFAGPFARWPRAADAALALVLLLCDLLLEEEEDGDALRLRPFGEIPVSAVVLYAVCSAALYLRRRAPLPVLGLVLLSWALALSSDDANLGGNAIVALYSVGRYGCDDRRAPVWVGAAIVVMALDGVVNPVPWTEIGFGAMVFVFAWSLGRWLRWQVLRRQQVQEQQQAEARRIVAEERTRIARELHDVVAHTVSLMTVQAGAARTVLADDPAAALRAMGAVEVAGRQALDELRHLLGVLRPDAAAGAEGPQPGLADLARLVEQTREAGLPVSLTTEGLTAGLPARVELSAYRIVQESLTNVVKHAGPQARARVHLGSDGTCLVVEVCDDGRGASLLPGSRHGIIGMHERALLLGGSLEVGPAPGGGFRVLARLPLRGGSA